jgi:hypothetical protein
MNKQDFRMSAVVFIAFAVFLPALSFGQAQKKSETNPGQEILDQLHPKPTRKNPPMGMKLLAGYKHLGAKDFEGNATGEIWKKDGLKITYAMGFSWGQEADPKDRDKYLQYWE